MVHNGLRGRIQRYKCKDCGRRFDGGHRRDKAQVITDYIEGKQTMEQLAEKYKVSSKTIARDLAFREGYTLKCGHSRLWFDVE